jgi:hypothetical protein
MVQHKMTTKQHTQKEVYQAGPSKISREQLRSMTQQAAYYRYLNRGCSLGRDVSDWLEAEKQLKEQYEIQ